MKIRHHWRELVAALAVLLSRLLTLPRTPWEHDEFLFIQAVRDFNPAQYRPHPPGYPLYVLLAKLFNFAIHDPFASLVTVSVLASTLGAVALTRAFANLSGDEDIGVAGALLFFFSAGMLVHSPLALADATAIAFVAGMFWALSAAPTNVTAALAAACGAAAIGCRPQLVIPLFPAMLVALFLIRFSNRQRLIGVAAFTVTCLVWFIPLIVESGGWDPLLAAQTRQAAYFAAHDAAQSRGAVRLASIATHFVFHPWGSKLVSLPLFALVAVGALKMLKRPIVPLIVFCAVHLAFAVLAMDPADAVRYALPGLLIFALAAASALRFGGRIAPWIGALVIASLAGWYAWPILSERHTKPSPSVAAIDYALANMPQGAILLVQPGLVPAVQTLVPREKWRHMNGGLRRVATYPQLPALVIFDGPDPSDADARTFEWRDSDPYRKLTRNVLRAVTVDDLRPSERYVPVKGVFSLETANGEAWRWLEPDAIIRIPAIGRSAVTLTFKLSHDAPYATNDVELQIDGRVVATVQAKRDAKSRVAVPLKPNAPTEIAIRSKSSFRPAEVLQNRDRRLLAVELICINQH